MSEEGQQTRDGQTTTTEGEILMSLPHGATFRPVPTHIDERGMLWVLCDPRWEDESPLTYTYVTTCRPGMAKGWALHKEHNDRYSLISGEILVVLYDDREDSSTRGLVSEIALSPHHRGTLTIPVGVWHAMKNLGATDAVVANCPTKLYDHANPDKYRLPIDSSEIPYTFRTSTQGW